jgi:Protein of unknown function (DUF3037)
MARIYSFAIVRVSPDPRRGELVNIGIAVFLPSGLDVRILPSLAKVHALHGELDLSELYGLPDRLATYARIKRSVADRYALIRSVGMVELSDLGQFRAVYPDSAEIRKTACQTSVKRFCLMDDPPRLPGQRIAPRPD